MIEKMRVVCILGISKIFSKKFDVLPVSVSYRLKQFKKYELTNDLY